MALYASATEFKDRMGIEDSSRDMAVYRILESASLWVEQVTGRRFYATTADEVRTYSLSWKDCGWEFYPPDDILSLTSLQTDADGNGVFENTWVLGTDYYLEPNNAALDGVPYTKITKAFYAGRYYFPSYQNAIRLTGKFSYCTLANCPPPIRELTMMAAETDAMPILDLTMPGVQNYKLGNEVSVTIGGRRLPPRAGEIVDLYRKGSGYVT